MTASPQDIIYEISIRLISSDIFDVLMIQSTDIHVDELRLSLVLEKGCAVLTLTLLNPVAVDSESTGVDDLQNECVSRISYKFALKFQTFRKTLTR